MILQTPDANWTHQVVVYVVMIILGLVNIVQALVYRRKTKTFSEYFENGFKKDFLDWKSMREQEYRELRSEQMRLASLIEENNRELVQLRRMRHS